MAGFWRSAPAARAPPAAHCSTRSSPCSASSSAPRAAGDETEAFIRRLVSEPVGVQNARAEATALGLAQPDDYWPALVGWDDGVPTPAELDGIGRAAQRRVHGSLAVALHGHMVPPYPPGACASDVVGWMEQVVSVARATVPALAARAVAADQEVAVHELREQVARLARLCARRGSGPPVTRARQHALEDLLSESVAPAEARRFVDDLLGPLIAWDHQHHSDLLRVLEAALDHRATTSRPGAASCIATRSATGWGRRATCWATT